MFTYPTQAELFSVIAQTKFVAFTQADWDCFAGCETKNPLIGYYNDLTIVIDGGLVNIVHSEDMYGGQMYCLKQLAQYNKPE